MQQNPAEVLLDNFTSGKGQTSLSQPPNLRHTTVKNTLLLHLVTGL